MSSTIDDPYWNWPLEERWIYPENYWRATRDGLDAMLICNVELFESIAPVAERLGCKEELFYITKILSSENGAIRQKRAHAQNQDAFNVIQHAIQAWKESLQYNDRP
ncbi:MAG: hypothetical protein QRY74_01115 [Chlamydia sp.]